LDPLVRQHTSTFSKTVEDFLLANDGEHPGCISMEEEHTQMLQEAINGVRPPPPTLTSTSHRSTVQELAYLSLVNYADVLLACCTCCCKRQHSRKDILDKGVVSQVEAFLNSNNIDCVWVGESEEMTQRLALVAYCDASDLDGSDPTLWLRVACSARSVGRIVAQRQRDPIIQGQNDETMIVPVYSRLERHALEQGLTCLPPGQAPNRIIVRALQEWTKTHPFSPTSVESQYPPRIQPDHPPAVKLVLVLPRYSWSTLGRMLMRACREGGAYSDTMGRTELSLSSQTIPFSRQSRAQKAWVTSFGSPQVQLCISPMLTLPPTALGTVCNFLGNGKCDNLAFF
jgi:hypothetical protein